jgi:hypothetical protein
LSGIKKPPTVELEEELEELEDLEELEELAPFEELEELVALSFFIGDLLSFRVILEPVPRGQCSIGREGRSNVYTVVPKLYRVEGPDPRFPVKLEREVMRLRDPKNKARELKTDPPQSGIFPIGRILVRVEYYAGRPLERLDDPAIFVCRRHIFCAV